VRRIGALIGDVDDRARRVVTRRNEVPAGCCVSEVPREAAVAVADREAGHVVVESVVEDRADAVVEDAAVAPLPVPVHLHEVLPVPTGVVVGARGDRAPATVVRPAADLTVMRLIAARAPRGDRGTAGRPRQIGDELRHDDPAAVPYPAVHVIVGSMPAGPSSPMRANCDDSFVPICERYRRNASCASTTDTGVLLTVQSSLTVKVTS